MVSLIFIVLERGHWTFIFIILCIFLKLAFKFLYYDTYYYVKRIFINIYKVSKNYRIRKALSFKG